MVYASQAPTLQPSMGRTRLQIFLSPGRLMGTARATLLTSGHSRSSPGCGVTAEGDGAIGSINQTGEKSGLASGFGAPSPLPLWLPLLLHIPPLWPLTPLSWNML